MRGGVKMIVDLRLMAGLMVKGGVKGGVKTMGGVR